MRSFVNLKDRLVEIVNEIVYYILIFILLIFNDRFEWTRFVKYLYLVLVFSNLIVTFGVGLISLFALTKEGGGGISTVTRVQRIQSTFDSRNMTGDLTNRNGTNDRIPAIYHPRSK
uniref:Uncharacterized protein n=1 Tax=Euplotes crassus TaxID=5936 RepID=A0A7S3KMM6_EUPCR|mmetsp:Transcript_32169/g.31583  ORF Transcript_32169/g.31583 Transcript_32169/m.31583 type:complete len:116 (+) Transcript_32169:362-709(+)